MFGAVINQGQVNKQSARVKSLRAPIKGWAVQTLGRQAPKDTALVLDNAFPEVATVRVRKGSTRHASGMGSAAVTHLAEFRDGATAQLLAFTDDKIYNATAVDADPVVTRTPIKSTWTSSNVTHALMTTTGDARLIICNGQDTAQIWDGTTIADVAIDLSALSITNDQLQAPWVYANRLFYVQEGTLNVLYGPVDNFAGTGARFPLNGVMKLGGTLIGGFAWSVDSGEGLDDLCVILSSEGEVAVYSGTDPASSWNLQGVYRIGRPLGNRCFLKAGGDVAVLTEDGIVPLSQAISLDRAALANRAITEPIAPVWLSLVQERGIGNGWQIMGWSQRNMALVSPPFASSNKLYTIVFNMLSGAPARFVGWDIRSMAVVDDQLYFGSGDGVVYTADTGGSDDGEPYNVTVAWAFQELDSSVNAKIVRAVRSSVISNTNLGDKLTCSINDSLHIPAAPNPATPIPGLVWGSMVWGSLTWGAPENQAGRRAVVSGYGYTIAPVWQCSFNQVAEPKVNLVSLDVVYEVGGMIT